MTHPSREPRAVAFRLLAQVLDRRRPLDEALADSNGFASLAPRDRALVRRLLATLLRRLGQVDDLIETCLNRPLKRGHGGVRNLLRLGAVQLAFLDTPAHAAVSTTLNLATSPRLAGHKGLINALLRRIDREGAALIAKQDAARLNTPRRLWQSWESAYGEVATRAIAEAHLSEPPLDLTVKSAAEVEIWADRLEARVLPNGSLRLPPGRGEIAKLPGYAEGAWWVQDAAAGLPVRLLGQVAGRRVVDLCAAPGGKTTHLAERMQDSGEIIAADISQIGRASCRERV
jgi:16S rRNA (cytosine967-C5)-methyltransferase